MTESIQNLYTGHDSTTVAKNLNVHEAAKSVVMILDLSSNTSTLMVGGFFPHLVTKL